MVVLCHCRDSDVVNWRELAYIMGNNVEKEAMMSVKELRTERGWSQEHLAQTAGLSLRTIQRIESGKRAGLDTLNGLAAVFGIDVKNIKQEPKMTTTKTTISGNARPEKNQAREYMNNIKSFKINFWAYIIVGPLLYILNTALTPDFLWAYIVGLAWGSSFLLHGIVINTIFGVFDLNMTPEEAERHFNGLR